MAEAVIVREPTKGRPKMATVTRSNVDAAARRVINSVARQADNTKQIDIVLGHGMFDKWTRSTTPQKNAVHAMLSEIYEIWLVQNDPDFSAGSTMAQGNRQWAFRRRCVKGISLFAGQFDWASETDPATSLPFVSQEAFELALREEAQTPRAHTINEGN